MSEDEQRAPRDDALPLSPMLKVVVLPDDAAGVMQELITMVDRLEMGEDDDCTSDLEGGDAAKFTKLTSAYEAVCARIPEP